MAYFYGWIAELFWLNFVVQEIEIEDINYTGIQITYIKVQLDILWYVSNLIIFENAKFSKML